MVTLIIRSRKIGIGLPRAFINGVIYWKTSTAFLSCESTSCHFTGLAAQMTKFLDSLFELLDVILFCFFIVLDWVVFLALVTRKVVWTFVSQALVETHRELVVTASKYCLEVLFLFRTLNVRHLTALINVWVIEIFGMDDTVSKLVFQTDFSENNGR